MEHLEIEPNNGLSCYCEKCQETKPEYSKIDHAHCWENDNPPCGQKIKHLECCLCKKWNPIIKSTIAQCNPQLKPFQKETEEAQYYYEKNIKRILEKL